MKKYIAIIMAITIAACLAACGNNASDNSASSEKEETVTEDNSMQTEAETETKEKIPVPELTVTSDLLGMCDTGNKTTLKVDLIYTSGPGDINLYHYDENGKRVIYDDEENITVALEPVKYQGSAILDLGDNVDDSLIDSSNAEVKLLDGNSYYADEMVFNATSLDGAWNDGKYTYTLETGDLEWNTWGYDTSADYNSSREWSIMGGDGNGVYYFRAEVSGIRYDGEEVAPAIIPFAVYCYGRSAADIAMKTEFIENTVDPAFTSGIAPSGEVQWNWFTEGPDSAADNKPYMQDTFTDYFSVIWPEGTDASGISSDDVTVTLFSEFGDEYILSEETAYGEHEVTVISNPSETVIAVTYQQWAFIPVYSTIQIDVVKDGETYSQTYDICSVGAYMTQTGGGGVTVDHTVTTYNYYGLQGMTLQNAANTAYNLTVEKDGTTYFYCEDADGKGYLAEGTREGFSMRAPEGAYAGDGTDIFHIAVLRNVVFAETRLEDNKEVKNVDGEDIEFTMTISPTKDIAKIVEDGAELQPGFALKGGAQGKWAWTKRYQSGWTTYSDKPTGLPYVDGYYGYGYAAGGSNPFYDTLIAETVN